MEFNSKLKGKITQSLIECLLEDSGLRILPLGIEEVIRELKALNQTQYFATDICKNLRTLPDFLVSNGEMTQTWLLEVKYRRRWNEKIRQSLFTEIYEQVASWQPLILAIFLGQPGHRTDTPASFLRLVRLKIHEGEICQVLSGERRNPLDVHDVSETCIPWHRLNWLDLPRIQDIFPTLSGTEQFEAGTLTKAISLVKRLAEIDLFDG